MTYSDIRTEVYRRLHFADSPDSSVATRIGMFVNQRYRKLLSTPSLRQLREGFTTLTTAASRAEYGLPYGITRVHRVREESNDRVLGTMSLDTYRSLYPDPTNTSSTPTSCTDAVTVTANSR